MQHDRFDSGSGSDWDDDSWDVSDDEAVPHPSRTPPPPPHLSHPPTGLSPTGAPVPTSPPAKKPHSWRTQHLDASIAFTLSPHLQGLDQLTESDFKDIINEVTDQVFHDTDDRRNYRIPAHTGPSSKPVVLDGDSITLGKLGQFKFELSTTGTKYKFKVRNDPDQARKQAKFVAKMMRKEVEAIARAKSITVDQAISDISINLTNIPEDKQGMFAIAYLKHFYKLPIDHDPSVTLASLETLFFTKSARTHKTAIQTSLTDEQKCLVIESILRENYRGINIDLELQRLAHRYPSYQPMPSHASAASPLGGLLLSESDDDEDYDEFETLLGASRPMGRPRQLLIESEDEAPLLQRRPRMQAFDNDCEVSSRPSLLQRARSGFRRLRSRGRSQPQEQSYSFSDYREFEEVDPSSLSQSGSSTLSRVGTRLQHAWQGARGAVSSLLWSQPEGTFDDPRENEAIRRPGSSPYDRL